jgi:hypothetical protein
MLSSTNTINDILSELEDPSFYGFEDIEYEVSGDTTNGSADIANVSDITYLVAGQSVSGTGIPAGAVISSISGTTVTMDQNATADGTTVDITFTTTDDTQIEEKLTVAVAEAKRLYVVPKLTTSLYEYIESKDKVSLTEAEEHVYYAEIFFSISCFFERHARSQMYARRARNESISQDGVTRGTHGSLGPEMAAHEYFEKAHRELRLAGIDTVTRIGRAGIYQKDMADVGINDLYR